MFVITEEDRQSNSSSDEDPDDNPTSEVRFVPADKGACMFLLSFWCPFFLFLFCFVELIVNKLHWAKTMEHEGSITRTMKIWNPFWCSGEESKTTKVMVERVKHLKWSSLETQFPVLGCLYWQMVRSSTTCMLHFKQPCNLAPRCLSLGNTHAGSALLKQKHGTLSSE